MERRQNRIVNIFRRNKIRPKNPSRRINSYPALPSKLIHYLMQPWVLIGAASQMHDGNIKHSITSFPCRTRPRGRKTPQPWSSWSVRALYTRYGVAVVGAAQAAYRCGHTGSPFNVITEHVRSLAGTRQTTCRSWLHSRSSRSRSAWEGINPVLSFGY